MQVKGGYSHLDTGEPDARIREEYGYKGTTMLRRTRLLRIANEAKEQGILLKTYTQIARGLSHSLEAVKDYIQTSCG